MTDRLETITVEFRDALTRVEGPALLEQDEDVLSDRRLLSVGLLGSNSEFVRSIKDCLFAAAKGDLEFEPDAGRLQGATDSQHGVIFGTLFTENDALEVAVKPFNSWRAGAVREFVAYEMMGRMGFESFKTLGIVACKESTFLVTKDEPTLKTFDNLRWPAEDGVCEGTACENVELLPEVATVLGQIHANGITHGDTQPKNVAISERGRVGFIDFESLIYDPKGILGMMNLKRIVGDCLLFYNKLYSMYGYYSDVDKKNRFKLFEQQFIYPYIKSFSENVDKNLLDINKFATLIRVNFMKLIVTE